MGWYLSKLTTSIYITLYIHTAIYYNLATLTYMRSCGIVLFSMTDNDHFSYSMSSHYNNFRLTNFSFN